MINLITNYFMVFFPQIYFKLIFINSISTKLTTKLQAIQIYAYVLR